MAELLEQLETIRARAEGSLHGVPYASRPGREMARNKARAELPAALAAYESELAANWGAILLDGAPDLVEQFAKMARDLGPAVVADASVPYAKIGAAIWATSRRDRKFEPSQFAAMRSAAEDIAAQLKIRAPELVYRAGIITRTPDAAALTARAAVVLADRGAMTAASVRQQASEAALASRYSKKVLVVVVTKTGEGVERQALAELFGQRLVTIRVTETNEDAVVQAFNQLKKHYKRSNT